MMLCHEVETTSFHEHLLAPQLLQLLILVKPHLFALIGHSLGALPEGATTHNMLAL